MAGLKGVKPPTLPATVGPAAEPRAARFGPLFGIVALLIGASRLTAKLHCPNDIMGGAPIAVASTGIACMGLKDSASLLPRDRR